MSRLQVMCADADRLVEQLPLVGLSGTALDDDCAIVFVPDGEDPDDVTFELNEYADRLGIRSIDEVQNREDGSAAR